MKDRYLEVTYRNGKPFAAYLHLPRRTDERSVRSEEVEHGMVIDYGPSDHPIGIELTVPGQVTIDRLNHVLKRLNLAPIRKGELSPLTAA